jgi:4-aminobutyrate aminotransferase/(S)-3-amino-2-methylpropionate transaminase
MLGQSGADAVTIAIKSAALATGRTGLVAFEGAYHGLSYAPLAACGLRASFREPFSSQLNPDVTFVTYPKTEAQARDVLRQIADVMARGTAGAVLVEPVLGRGGVVPAPEGFLERLGLLAKQHGVLIIADEIWTGMGRSGSIVRSVAEGLVPDLLCLGKGLGASFPISACVGSEAVMLAWARGGEVVHTSTHAGAPVGCAAALATIDAVVDGKLDERAARLGRSLVEAIRGALGARAVDVRGAGLLVGVELASGKAGLGAFRKLLERGYMVTVGGSAAEVVVITPPLTIDEPLLLDFPRVLADVVREVEP